MSSQPIVLIDNFSKTFIQAGLLNESAASNALVAAQQAKISFVAFLIQHNLVEPGSIAQQVAEHLRLPRFDLAQWDIKQLPHDLLDEQFIKQHRLLPLFTKDHDLYLAITEPEHLDVLSEIKFYTDLNVQPMVVEYDKLAQIIDEYLSQRQYHALSNFQQLSTSNHTDDERIVQFVQQILIDAMQKGASDIHFEPYKTSYRIRLRIDGILHKVAQLPLDVANRITARLKIMSKLDISERRLPQDGRFSVEMEQQHSKDCRISTCPTLFGEKIVVRILDSTKASLNIDELGLESDQKTLFLNAIQRPQGMVLVTGPTGSGKTVSLYTALNLLNTLDKNICTVEEPVEIQVPGINQVNVNLKTDLTFSKVLRSFLRQDPDIIMVGEIRDKETAEIAIKAAQTGHLVLSTLHTNSAAETLIRLINMGIAAFNIIHSVHLIIAQRLVRKLCVYCKRVQTMSQENLLAAGFQAQELDKLIIYEPGECKRCMKGYSGRLGIFEFLPLSEKIRKIIVTNGSANEIADEAARIGMHSLREVALNKVRMGITSLAEINRVIV